MTIVVCLYNEDTWYIATEEWSMRKVGANDIEVYVSPETGEWKTEAFWFERGWDTVRIYET